MGWTALALVWLRRFRWSAYLELDEAGYAGMSLRLATATSLDSFGEVLANEGTHGPLQALLAFAPQRLLHPDPRVLLIQNVLLAAATGLVACLTVRRLADRAAGTIAGTLVLLSPGVIEHGQLALTTTPSSFAGMLVVYFLVRAHGLERAGVAALAGVALGSMTLARSMTVGFAPALVVMALGWALARRTSASVAIRGAAALLAGALASAAWWWYLRWADVSHYLLGGGSSDTERHRDPGVKFATHAGELIQHVGTMVVVVGVGLGAVLVARRAARSERVRDDGADTAARRAALVDVGLGVALATVLLLLVTWPGLSDANPEVFKRIGILLVTLPWVALALVARLHVRARRRTAAVGAPLPVDPAEPAGDRPLAVWPLWAGVAAALATLSFSTAYGVGFVLPLVPWTVVAGVVTARRSLSGRWWTTWWAATVVAGIAMAATVPGTGVEARLVFCGPDAPRAYCAIDSNADGLAWRQVSDRIADRFVTATVVGRGAGVEDPRLALTGRDLTVNGNTVQLSMEWRHGFSLDVWSFFGGDASVAAQLDEVRREADMVVVVPDRYEQLVIGLQSPTPDEVIEVMGAGGFRPCEEIPTPGGDPVLVFVSSSMPGAACAGST